MEPLTDEIARVLAEPKSSDWLRAALRAALARDPVDAANDAEQLARLLTGRVEVMRFLDAWSQPKAVRSLSPTLQTPVTRQAATSPRLLPDVD